MNKKDYKLIALWIRETKKTCGNAISYKAVSKLEVLLLAQNPKFDSVRFRQTIKGNI